MAENNINKLTKKNQIVLAILIASGIAASVGGIWYVNKMNDTASLEEIQPQFDEEPELEPNLTGAVTNTFDGTVGSQVVTDAQAESKKNRESLDLVLEKLDSIEQRMADTEKENIELKKRLEDSEKLQLDLIEQMGNVNTAPAPVVEEVVEAAPTVNRTKMNTSSGNNKTSLSQNGVIKLESPHVVKGAFERKTLTKKGQTSSNSRFYIPSGAFSNAIVLEGADASAAVTARESNVVPMQFKLTGKLHLPANKKMSKLEGCFVTAGTYGDISSERAIVRLERLSCVIGGKHIDQKVKGHVAFYGKNGIKGVPVMRNGKILGLAFASGALGGLGGAVSQIGDTQVGLGASRTVGSPEVIREALGSGTSTAANKLAEYYIQLAEQYHPVIPIGAANRVEIVFQEGFWAEFIEDQAESSTSQSNAAQVEQEPVINNIPADLQRQLGEVSNQSLSDFVTPSQK